MSDLSAASPREIDERLAALDREEMRAYDRRDAAINDAHRALGERPRGKHWPTTDIEAITRVREAAKAAPAKQPWDRHHPADAVADLDAAHAELARVKAEMAPLNAEYARRPWSRFLLVTSSDGHIHRDMSCSTCRIRTQYAWLPELSGKTEADAVAEQGTRLCSMCFPSAPVEWTLGLDRSKDRCAGGVPVAGSTKRVGMNTYGQCPSCTERGLVTGAGVMRKHKPPKAEVK